MNCPKLFSRSVESVSNLRPTSAEKIIVVQEVKKNDSEKSFKSSSRTSSFQLKGSVKKLLKQLENSNN